MTTGRRVLVLGYFVSQSGGIYRQVCEELAARLAARGWQVTSASHIGSRPLRMLHMLWTIVRARQQYSVAYIDVFSGLGFVQAELNALLLRALGKPYVLALHGGNLPEFSRRFPGRVRRLLSHAVSANAPSPYLQNALASIRPDIGLIPNAMEAAHYTFRLRTTPAPRLVWLRALHSNYNPVMAVEVVDRLRAHFPDVHLHMVGPDKGDGTLEAVQAAIAMHGLEGHITLVGGVPKSEVPAWLDKADVFISTTDFDNTPVSVIEAMVSGLPLVSTNVGGVPDLVTDGVHGLLVPPRDPDAMAAAVMRILTEPGLSARLSETAHAYASGFDWGNVLQQWEQALTTAAEARSVETGGGG
jgi:glycosyltransferase involved in cell wall biosynthesis